MVELFTSWKKIFEHWLRNHTTKAVLHNKSAGSYHVRRGTRMALRVGDYVKQTSQPEWGIGRVVSIGESGKVTVIDHPPNAKPSTSFS